MTQQEFNGGHDGLHVELACELHPELRWSCKKIALTKDATGKYRYNHSRHLFFKTGDGECDCPPDKLYAVIEG